MKKLLIIIGVLVVVIGFGIFLANESNKPAIYNDFTHVPGSSELLNNLNKAGLDALGAEGTVLHIHQHLDIMVNGKNIPVPGEVGIGSDFISPIHTHDDSGVIHVESPVQKDFKLGQFFDEWGVTLNNNCVGTYCADSNNKLVAAVNGKQISDPQNYVLKAHDEIEIWYGPKSQTPELVKSYNFPAGL